MANLIAGEVPTWSTIGAGTAIVTTTALADTGAIGSVGTYLARVIVSVDATAVLNLQWRNAANDGNNKEQRLHYGATQRDGFLLPFRVDAVNERLRLLPNANATLNACASIIWEKVS